MNEEPSVKILQSLKAALAAAAQMVYDSWEQDEEGSDEEYGYGGICHDIADAMSEVLSGAGVEASSVSQSIGEVHVFVVAKFAEGVYAIDIPPSTYERGSAYTWSKIKGVRFSAQDIDVSLVDKNPARFEEYLENSILSFREWMESCGFLIVRRSWPFLSGEDEESPEHLVSRKSRRGRRR